MLGPCSNLCVNSPRWSKCGAWEGTLFLPSFSNQSGKQQKVLKLESEDLHSNPDSATCVSILALGHWAHFSEFWFLYLWQIKRLPWMSSVSPSYSMGFFIQTETGWRVFNNYLNYSRFELNRNAYIPMTPKGMFKNIMSAFKIGNHPHIH